MAGDRDPSQKAGQRLALVIAGVGIGWVFANLLGAEYGWSNRTRALFDLIALAGFGFAIVVAIELWRKRRDNKD